MTPIDAFIAVHNAQLIIHIDALRTGLAPGPEPLAFVHRVLDAFEPLKPALAHVPVTLPERTFWFALYQLETLVEHPTPGFGDAYEQMMLCDLKALRHVLERGEDLPERYFATRPGEPLGDYDARDEEYGWSDADTQ